ncbi:class I SAM-dependent methyltransferase [Paenibacillus lautus]|uniref:class I SAM-dependent methyltransferase n=1 Tax=Paenibacillus lautus TaxID=1401 RepID=UPI003D27C22D
MTKLMDWLHEQTMFLGRFLLSPGQIGSVAPSSKELALAMMKPVPWGRIRTVAELGAGTGVITKQIQLAAGAETQVILFEKDPYLRGQLKERYPNYPCYTDGSHLRLFLKQEGIESLDCIISGLPFFNFPQYIRDRIVAEIVATLKKDGLFIAFQYSQQMKRQLMEHFDILDIHFVPRNFPPAFVYVCRKKEGSSKAKL